MNRIAKGIIMGTLGVFISGGALTFAVNKNNQTNYSNINTQNLITPVKAKEIMLNNVPNGTFVEFSFDASDNPNEIPTFDGKLIKDNIEYDIEINAKDGSIFKLEKEALLNSSETTTNTTNNITSNNDTQKAPNKVDNTNTNINQNNTNNLPQETTTTKPQQKFIGEEKAKNIMLSKVPNSKITKFYLDNDNTPEYEGTLINGNTKYDISVNAITGAILEFEKEIIKTSQTTSKPSAPTNTPVQSNVSHYDDHDDIYEDDHDDHDNDYDDVHDND
ncbi:cell surface protein [Clostridium perfringens D str. JGS1721]|uniref:Cell surface protein n=1 Tax=Clostridium perfringens D str. JGS1721 TaxID=488537 RepID=B1V6G1_CLOPF|nr:PepSY domain-containing protein [Clostridium perfringens]EDT70601.1 cell surface protein [Clostridium perfringens D str. JGS1721]